VSERASGGGGGCIHFLAGSGFSVSASYIRGQAGGAGVEWCCLGSFSLRKQTTNGTAGCYYVMMMN
jgi:hypothetical protein